MKTINTYINEKLRLTAKHQYTCQPENKGELRDIIKERIKNEGNECDLNDIDVSKIIDMSNLFDIDYGVLFMNFNGDISMWNVSNVKNMHCMFYRCIKFNCDLSQWNVSNVKTMRGMFNSCKNFNCDISSWNMSNVEDIRYMFEGCEKFNKNLDSWNVSDSISMYHAFDDCPTQPTWYDKDKW